ncbi:whirlin protein dyschronic isoform X7 [Halictus rubicundus]|uniref:whirlin protein dyschronic isoform X7 n=1 Tax=Halictus rubicundus TaxID=77578 RepID=UPI0040351B66
MASSTEDYGSELQELQWGGGTGSHFLRSGSHFLRSGTGVCYEAEDLEPTSRHHGGQHRGYYSPPGTSYTIVERPPSAQHYHSSHTTPYRHRGHTTGGTGAISPEQVLRLFGNGVSERRQGDRRTPASSPASVSAVRTSSSSSSQQQQQQQQSQQSQSNAANPPTSPSSQPLSLQELTVRTVTMTRDPPDSHHGFGICVKGGKDAGEIRSTFRLPPSPYFAPQERVCELFSGVGVYISRVEEGSVAERAGLRPGDTILEVNGTPFRSVTHEEALTMLKSCRTLSMTVRGPALDPRCRVGHPVWSTSGRQQSCSWMDRQGRPASPPPVYPPRDSRYCPRTRKVELCIEPGQSLGLMIRGGLEYGLGIYVTGVDKDSVADRAGLLVGDQIIEVNNQSFEEATHDEAVQILKTNKRMTLLIRDVGKVPHSCTTSQPIVMPTSRYSDHDPLLLESPGNHRPPSPSIASDWRHRGGVHTVSAATAAMVEEKARVVLARSERAALSQLLADYRTRRLTIEELVASLADLLNTHEKLTLLTELRELVDSKDRPAFDDLVYRPRVSRRKGDRAHSDLLVTPSLHDLPSGLQEGTAAPSDDLRPRPLQRRRVRQPGTEKSFEPAKVPIGDRRVSPLFRRTDTYSPRDILSPRERGGRRQGQKERTETVVPGKQRWNTVKAVFINFFCRTTKTIWRTAAGAGTARRAGPVATLGITDIIGYTRTIWNSRTSSRGASTCRKLSSSKRVAPVAGPPGPVVLVVHQEDTTAFKG